LASVSLSAACVTYLLAQKRGDIQKARFAQRPVVITETMPHVRSVSVGLWVRNGSAVKFPKRTDSRTLWSTCLQGTERPLREAIAREMIPSAAMADAFTSRRQICFNAKILDEPLPIAFDVIATRAPPEWSEDERRKPGCLEEIKWILDNPEYLFTKFFTRGFWPQHSLGRSDSRTPETVKAFNRDSLFTALFGIGSRRII